MKKVIATLFTGSYPIFILEDGTVMSPRNTPTGSCWALDWEVSSQYTAKVHGGVSGGGEYGYNITVFEDGKKVADISTAS